MMIPFERLPGAISISRASRKQHGLRRRKTYFQPLEHRLMLDVGGASQSPTTLVGPMLAAYAAPQASASSQADVVAVAVTPFSVQAGTSVAATAKVFNTANATQNVLVHVSVVNSANTVVRSPANTSLNLTEGDNAVSVPLPAINTSGLANGVYTINVSLLSGNGSPLPGDSSQSPFVVGLPISAAVSASPASLPPGNSTVTTTITVSNQAPVSGGKSTADQPSASSTIATPATTPDQVKWTGGTTGKWDVAANWLDTTTNTSHVPTANDAVTISGGATVTVEAGNQTALSVQVAADSNLDISGGNLTLGAASEIDGGFTINSNLTLGGTLTVTGTSQWIPGTNIAINLQGNTLKNTGTMTLGSATANTLEALETRDKSGNPLSGGTLLNTGTMIQQGPGTLDLFDTAAVANQGSYQITGAGRVTSSAGSLFSPFNNQATLDVQTSGTLTFLAPLNNSGTLDVTSGTLNAEKYVNNTGTVVADGAAIDLNGPVDGGQIDSGNWTARHGGTISFSGIVSNQASLTLDGTGSTFSGLEALAENLGTLTVTNGATLGISNALDNRGTITIGPASTLKVMGNYSQEASGTLDYLLAGAGSGQFGVLTVTKSTMLGGLLRAEPIGGYAPAAGDSMTVSTSVGSTGQFAGIVLPATATTALAATTSPNNIVLAAHASTASPTTTVVTSNFSSGATYGHAITFTAKVAPASGSGTPSGSVQFQIDGSNFGGPTALNHGTATLNATLTVGQHTIDAIFLSSNAKFAGSSDAASPLIQTVKPGTDTPAPNATLFYSVGGSNSVGSISDASVNVSGTTLSVGSPLTVSTTPGDGLVFLPNGNLLVGGEKVNEVNPSTGAVVATLSMDDDHLALDPSGSKVWTSAEGGSLVEIDLPALTTVTHTLAGADHGVTQLAFDAAGDAFYTNSGQYGNGSFGEINLTTFTTTQLFKNLPAAHGLTFDPYTGDFILFGAGSISQFDPRTMKIVSSRSVVVNGLDQGTVDGHGHLYAADNNGNLIFIDYSATGLVGDPSDFVATPFITARLDDFAPLSGIGSPGLPFTVADSLASGGYVVNPTSLAPSNGSASSTAVNWIGQFPANQSISDTFKFTGTVTGLAPGQTQAISQGTTVTSLVAEGNGSLVPVTIQFPPVIVWANHDVSLTPPRQSVVANATATYTIVLSNPSSSGETYRLSIAGLTSGETADFESSVSVAAGKTADVPLTIHVPAGAATGMQVFVVSAKNNAGAIDSAQGQLTVTPNTSATSMNSKSASMAGRSAPDEETVKTKTAAIESLTAPSTQIPTTTDDGSSDGVSALWFDNLVERPRVVDAVMSNGLMADDVADLLFESDWN